MAYLFDDGTGQYIENASAVVGDAPLTMACWFNSDDITQVQTLIDIGEVGEAVNVQHQALLLVSSHVWALTQNLTNTQAIDTGGALSSNTWYHACGVWTDADNRAAFVDGGNKGTDSTNKQAFLLDTTRIGRRSNAVNTQYMSGMIAEVGIWNVALTDAEVAILAHGYSPLLVRPESLYVYLPMVRNLVDVTWARPWTANGSPTIAPHPRVMMPALTRSIIAEAPPAPTGQPTTLRSWVRHVGAPYQRRGL